MYNTKKHTFFFLFVLVCSTALFALPNIAVLELSGNGIDANDLYALTNRLRTDLFKTDSFTVLERGVMDEVLKEQGFQQTGCTEAACAVEVGKLLNVEYMVSGSVDRIGSAFSVNIRMINVQTGHIVKNVTADCKGCKLEDVFINAIRQASGRLAGIPESQINKGTDTFQQFSSADKPKKRTLFFRLSPGWGLIPFEDSEYKGPSIFPVYGMTNYDVKKPSSLNMKTSLGVKSTHHFIGLRTCYYTGGKNDSVRILRDSTEENYNFELENGVGVFLEYSFIIPFLNNHVSLEPGILVGLSNQKLTLNDTTAFPSSESPFIFNFKNFGGPRVAVTAGFPRFKVSFEYMLGISNLQMDLNDQNDQLIDGKFEFEKRVFISNQFLGSLILEL